MNHEIYPCNFLYTRTDEGRLLCLFCQLLCLFSSKTNCTVLKWLSNKSIIFNNSHAQQNDILKLLNLHDAWHYFSTTFDSIIAECIPLDVLRPKKNVYVSHQALHLKNKKCKPWNQFMTTKSPTVYKSYCQARNSLCSLTRNLHDTYEKKLVS